MARMDGSAPAEDDSYERHKASAARRQSEKSAKSRDVGTIPKPKNQKRRDKCKYDLKLYCETYLKELFPLEWSPDHLKALAKTQSAILEGGLFALAMPRGSGKTTIFIAAIMWAVMYGHHKFGLLVGASQKASKTLMGNIKKQLSGNELLLQDFPEICVPIRKLQGIANRAAGQTHNGNPTNIVWGKETIILAMIEGCEAAGGIIQTGAIRSAVRGANIGGLRPTLCLLDDPQTKASARSDTQTDEREEIIAADVLGLPAPGDSITALMACTVIEPGEPGDLAARFLDRKRHPDWQGERFQLLYKFPDNMDLWREYRELIVDAQSRDASPDAVRKLGTAFYRKHRKAMDAGHEIAWSARKGLALSALQYAMDLFFRDEAAFWSEFQNQPQARSSASDSKALDADTVARRINQLDRFQVPLEAQHLTAFIDVHKDLLYWAIGWFAADFTGGFLDYGTYPDQKKLEFKLRDASPTLRQATGQRSVQAAVRAALDHLATDLLSRKFVRPDGLELAIERLGTDANWGESTDTVYAHVREHDRKSIMRPCHGKGFKPTEKPMSEWPKKTGEKLGYHWLEKVGTRATRFMVVDSGFWKTFLFNGFSLPFEERHSLSLYKAKPHEHRLLASHLASEIGTPVESKGRTIDVWEVKPGGPDNHWLDCFSGCCVMASNLGVELKKLTVGTQGASPSERPQPRWGSI